MLEVNAKMDYFLKSYQDETIQEAIRFCAQPSVSAKGEGIAVCVPWSSSCWKVMGRARLQTAGKPVVVGEAQEHHPGDSVLQSL
jgi:hypothetical protein